jgi:5-methyltetrahydrofolate--homocysteine methyltransferase
VTFEQVKAAYAEQIGRLAEGGVDLLLIETIFDTLTPRPRSPPPAKVAPASCRCGSRSRSSTSAAGTLSGQTVEAFWRSIEHAAARSSSGSTARWVPQEMRPHVAELSPDRRHLTSPATRTPGLPERVRRLRRETRGDRRPAGEFAARAWSTSSAAAAARPRRTSRRSPPRSPAAAARSRRRDATRFSGLEPFEIGPDTGFVMIGERTNVTGSARFRRLIEAATTRAPSTSRSSRCAAAPTCSTSTWTPTCSTASGDDDVPQPDRHRARGRPHPDHDRQLRWSVLEAGLQCVQGKGVVNSISLKEGEEPFLEQARGSATTARAWW